MTYGGAMLPLFPRQSHPAEAPRTLSQEEAKLLLAVKAAAIALATQQG
jgi:hypothetical protein